MKGHRQHERHAHFRAPRRTASDEHTRDDSPAARRARCVLAKMVFMLAQTSAAADGTCRIRRVGNTCEIAFGGTGLISGVTLTIPIAVDPALESAMVDIPDEPMSSSIIMSIGREVVPEIETYL